jgi:hypothetical protein
MAGELPKKSGSIDNATAKALALKIGTPVNVKHFGAVGNGITNDSLAIQAAIDHSATFDNPPYVNLQAGSSYLIQSKISIKKRGQILGCDNGMAEILIDINDANATGIEVQSIWQWGLKNVKIKVLSPLGTVFKVGDGDTWNGLMRDVWIDGQSLTKQGICYTNTNISHYRDYFSAFENISIRNCEYLFTIGYDAVSGTNALMEVNRIRLSSVDFYGHSVYGLYFGNGNGHMCDKLHFTNAVAGALSDIRIIKPFHQISGVCESGAIHAVIFDDTNSDLCAVNLSVYGYENAMKSEGAIVKINLPVRNINNNGMGIQLQTETYARIDYFNRIHPSDIIGYSNSDLPVSPIKGNKFVVRFRDNVTGLADPSVVEFAETYTKYLKKVWLSDQAGAKVNLSADLTVNTATITTLAPSVIKWNKGNLFDQATSRFNIGPIALNVTEVGSQVYSVNIQITWNLNAASLGKKHTIILRDPASAGDIAIASEYAPVNTNEWTQILNTTVSKGSTTSYLQVRVQQDSGADEAILSDAKKTFIEVTRMH